MLLPKKTRDPIKRMMTTIVATLVMVTSDFFLEKDPNTCPMINTMQATNNTQKKIGTGKNMVYVFKVRQ